MKQQPLQSIKGASRVFLSIFNSVVRFGWFRLERLVTRGVLKPLGRLNRLGPQVKPQRLLSQIGFAIVFLGAFWLTSKLVEHLIGHAQLMLLPSSWVRFSFYAELARNALLLVFQVVGYFILISALLGIISWLSGCTKGTAILAFENDTQRAEFGGRTIADSLIAELHRIHYIHRDYFLYEEEFSRTSNLGSIPVLVPSGENLEDHLVQVGSIGIGDYQIPIGRLLIALRKLWPFGKPGQVITGSVHQYGHTIRLVARIEDVEVKAWDVTGKLSCPEDMLKLVKELAYKVAIHINPKIKTKNWRTFQCYTEATANFLDYIRSKSLSALQKAYFDCEQAIDEDQKYTQVTSLLCNISRSLLNEDRLDSDKLKLAEKLVGKVAEIDSNSADVVYAYNILGNLNTRQKRYQMAQIAFDIAKAKDPFMPYSYIGTGTLHYHRREYDRAIADYKHAYHLSPELFQAHFNLGIVYAKKNDLEMAARHFKNAKGILETKQNSQFHARVANGLGWIYLLKEDFDRAIRDLSEAVYMERNFYLAFGNLGIAYLKRHEIKAEHNDNTAEMDLEFAREALEKAVAICQNQAGLDPQLRHVLYGLLLLEIGPNAPASSKVREVLLRLDHALSHLTQEDRSILEDAVQDAEVVAKCPSLKQDCKNLRTVQCYIAKCSASLAQLYGNGQPDRERFSRQAAQFCGTVPALRPPPCAQTEPSLASSPCPYALPNCAPRVMPRGNDGGTSSIANLHAD